MDRVIAVAPRGDDLAAVTRETRDAVVLAAIGGYVTQVWTWRGGEAVVLNADERRGRGDWRVIVRRGGLKRGRVEHVQASSFADAMRALGIAYRIKSARRPPPPVQPGSREWLRAQVRRGARRRGNTFRTLRMPASAWLAAFAAVDDPARGVR